MTTTVEEIDYQELDAFLRTKSEEDLEACLKYIYEILRQASYLNVPMQVGVGLASGQGSAPVIMAQISPSGGEIYETQYFVDIGAMGSYSTKVIFHYFCTGYEIVPKIMISDPVPWTVYEGGSVEIHDAGY